MDDKRVKHLVVDSGAFIKNSPVHEYAEHIYTVDGVIKEIKDKETLQRLQFLPYKLVIKEPSTDVYKYVLEFSKKTGDYSNLSVVDLKIIALTYQLEKEHVGTDHLNKEPSCKVTGKQFSLDSNLNGFYYPKKDSSEKVKLDEEDIYELARSELSSDEDYESVSEGEEENNENVSDGEIKNNENVSEGESKNNENVSEGESENNENVSEGENENNSEEEEENGEDSDTWITPSNIAEIKKKITSLNFKQTSSTVACVTTDFAVQNVLLQIGLNMVSVDGMLVREARVFILRCYACYKTTTNITKKFCPNCGNKTMKRVAVTVNDDGEKNVHINFRRPINIRGKRFSLPTPKGGKHAINPIVCEDQPIPHNRMPKAFLKKTNALEDDYVAQKSPFAFIDVYSRSVNLGVHVHRHFEKKNPNVTSKRTGNKKRK